AARRPLVYRLNLPAALRVGREQHNWVAVCDRLPVLEANRRDVDVQGPGEDRLVLEPSKRLATGVQASRSAQAANHPIEAVDLLRPQALLAEVAPLDPGARDRG